MSNKSKVKSSTVLSQHRSKRSTVTGDGNLYLSPSFIGKLRKYVGRRKQKSRYSKTALNPVKKESATKNNGSNDSRLAASLPKDAAVHFGTFYGVQASDANKPQAGGVKSFVPSAKTASYKSAPRFEFTRQMVQKLERTAGTEEYARQVSALLEETAEPAHFKLHSLPTENSIPEGRYNPSGFPLWYKDPYKMPFTSEDMYRLARGRFDRPEGNANDTLNDDSSEENSWEDLSEYDVEDEQESFTEMNIKNLLKGMRSSLHLSTTESSSVTEAKDTDSRESN